MLKNDHFATVMFLIPGGGKNLINLRESQYQIFLFDINIQDIYDNYGAAVSAIKALILELSATLVKIFVEVFEKLTVIDFSPNNFIRLEVNANNSP
ncbi:hypothetical protein CDAR_611551 [Caerostris darwini]|uniref:Uncharacterized protein n=1 Tax=Caerostris darwini TaxID=1538125 RepID=A0AAV4U2M8_9ARAC|nr:hypothetical protein CDAR_611551 [Caerostris darwini]